MPEYSSNVRQIVTIVNNKLRSLKDTKRLLGIATEQLAGDLIIRVHENGKDADGQAIGNYSTKETYVSINYLKSELRVTGKKKVGKTP